MKNVYSSLGLILIVFSIIYLLGYASGQEERVIPSGPPDFSLKTIEGEEIKLKDYRGKKVVHLVFWATWCPKCLMEMSELKKLWNTIESRPYEILAINVGVNDSIKRIKKIQKKYQIPFKIILDITGEITKNSGVISVPTHIIIDKDGVIIDRFNVLPKDPVTFLNKIFTGKKTS